MTVRIPARVRRRIREAAGDRCGYCRTPQRLIWGKLEIDHIEPHGLGGSSDELNLWLACSECNSFKQARTVAKHIITGDSIRLFNPRTQVWHEHFRWIDGGERIEGVTATGQVTVDTLRFNDEHLVELRKIWISSGLWQPLNE